MRHVIVYAEKVRFAGWPANNGVWIWDGDEILVGFTLGDFEEKKGHNIRPPYVSALARSKDGGETWALDNPDNYVGKKGTLSDPSGPVDFTAPGFAMRVAGTGYFATEERRGEWYVSLDRGNSWKGPYSFGSLMEHEDLKGMDFTSRTDYLVNGPADCLVFMSARKPGLTDRAFCARTTDGGMTFRFVSWIVPPADPYRGVMPATVRCSPAKLVTAIRRREPGTDRCWIDAYASTDNGETWSVLGKVGDTGPANGNPPALVRMRGGRLCCVFGDRERRRIVSRYSRDEGATWGDGPVLRSDFLTDAHGDADLGYPRVVQRADGRLVACYYWATASHPQQYIDAAIWDPEG